MCFVGINLFMKLKNFNNWWQRLLQILITGCLLFSLSFGLSGAFWDTEVYSPSTGKASTLAQGDAITDPKAILRYALPIDNPTVRRLQADIEGLSKNLRGKRWNQVASGVKDAKNILTISQDKILNSVPEEKKQQAQTLLEEINSQIEELQEKVAEKDKEGVWLTRKAILDKIGDLEALMVQGFPFEIPEKYSDLPRLLGRATVKINTTKGDITVVVDGYNAPLTAGNFVDLVQRGFYQDLPIIRGGRDDFVVQTGKPPGAEGFIDPKTKKYRKIPFEVLAKGDKEPTYEVTLEDLGRYLDPPVLPFNAYGAVGMARPEDDINAGSSQFFFFKFDRELTPPGYNLMDGRYAVFGYVVDGKEVLEELTTDDKIISAKVIEGAENLVQPE